MILHFIFVIKEEDLDKRKSEFEYIKKMAQFYKKWIKDNFGIDYEIQCDELITKPTKYFPKTRYTYTCYVIMNNVEKTSIISILLISDHYGLILLVKDIMQKILEWFFGKNQKSHDDLFLAEKNCTTVSHEINS